MLSYRLVIFPSRCDSFRVVGFLSKLEELFVFSESFSLSLYAASNQPFDRDASISIGSCFCHSFLIILQVGFRATVELLLTFILHGVLASVLSTKKVYRGLGTATTTTDNLSLETKLKKILNPKRYYFGNTCGPSFLFVGNSVSFNALSPI